VLASLHRAQLQREPNPVAIATALGDQPLVSVVEEEPLQLCLRRRAYKTTVGRFSLAWRLRDHHPAR
jgi:hypothetical protein